MPFRKLSHLLHISLLGAQAIVLVTNSLTDLIQKPCGAQHRTGGLRISWLNLVLFFYKAHRSQSVAASFFPTCFRVNLDRKLKI